MKKVLVFFLCLSVLCMPLSAFAEESENTHVETTTTVEVVEDPAEDEIPSNEEIEGDTTIEETPNDEDAPAEEDSSNGETSEDSSNVEDETVEETPTEEDVPVDTPTDDTTETPSEDVPTDTPTEDAPVEDETTDVPTEEDTPVETPTDAPTTTPDDEPIVDAPTGENPVESEKTPITDVIANWLLANADTITLILSVIAASIAIFKKLGAVLKAMGIINDNAVTVATDSAAQMKEVQEMIASASNAVTGYDGKIKELLEAFAVLLDENKLLKDDVKELKTYLHTSTSANVEFANELSELIGLANIPTYKKDELGRRHLEAVRAIYDAETNTMSVMEQHDAPVEEVKENDGEEA